jgi:type II secretory pathway component PulM
MKIKSIERELELVTYTRKMAREVNELAVKGATLDESGKPVTDMVNALKAQELAVKLRFALSQEELDNMEASEFDSLVAYMEASDLKKNSLGTEA